LEREILNLAAAIFHPETTGFKVEMKSLSPEMKDLRRETRSFSREVESFNREMINFNQRDDLRREAEAPSPGKETPDRASYRKCK
jgi:hypothetical protein